jgi:hypothetical protein
MFDSGPVIPFAPAAIADLVEWVRSIPFELWPQQRRVDSQLRPAMVNDGAWWGMAQRTNELVSTLMAQLRLSRWAADGFVRSAAPQSYQRMLSVVMPGHSIPAHADRQEPGWLCRVHVPLLSNERSVFQVGGVVHVMRPGTAYLVDVTQVHAVENRGETPRIHFMFDVREAA